MIFASFEELGRYKGIRPPVFRQKRDKTCRKCGAVLREIPGTNVLICDGVGEDGKPCGNRVLNRVHPILD